MRHFTRNLLCGLAAATLIAAPSMAAKPNNNGQKCGQSNPGPKCPVSPRA
jgi:hypothetical protein